VGGLAQFGFAAGDPVNFSDPFGLTPCPDGWRTIERYDKRGDLHTRCYNREHGFRSPEGADRIERNKAEHAERLARQAELVEMGVTVPTVRFRAEVAMAPGVGRRPRLSFTGASTGTSPDRSMLSRAAPQQVRQEAQALRTARE
jgi:hypothetical protein